MPLSEDAGAWSNDELAGAQLFHPGWLFRNRHLQTMLGNLPPVPWLIRRRAAPLRAAATELLLDCGDGVRLQSFVSVARASGTALRPMAVLLHGWEGSTESGYVMSLGALLFSRGFDVLRLNLRDHGSTHHLNRGIFHSCRLPEVVGAARAIAARFPEAPLFLAGFSLGGNFMLRVAADAGAPPSIAGAAAISPVLDPATTLDALERGPALYRRYFVRRWSQSLRRKQQAWPGVYDFEEMLRLAQLRGMTAGLVRRHTEFPSLEAYLEGYAITGGRLADLRVGASILLAEDDPIIPLADVSRLDASAPLRIVRTRHGGHCGFADSLGGPSAADRFVLDEFRTFDRRFVR
ncbi:MAG: alpha/beta fold hydrolase [Steroidobacteraceae bacterium]|jgi:predicted alpha/beta-fold hydrolase